jgi:hypothetical protein
MESIKLYKTQSFRRKLMVIRDLEYLEVISESQEVSAIQGGRAIAFGGNISKTLGAFGFSKTFAFASGQNGASASGLSGSASIASGGTLFAAASGGIWSANSF